MTKLELVQSLENRIKGFDEDIAWEEKKLRNGVSRNDAESIMRLISSYEEDREKHRFALYILGALD